jgi:hypothetical protein
VCAQIVETEKAVLAELQEKMRLEAEEVAKNGGEVIEGEEVSLPPCMYRESAPPG